MKGLAAVVLVLLLAAPLAPARAQVESREGIALQNQILELRQELAAMRDAPSRGGTSLGAYQSQSSGASPELSAQLLDRVQRLEEAVRLLRGRIDESDNARQRQADDLGKQIGDLSFRLDSAGVGGGAPASRPPTMSPPPSNLDAAAPSSGGDDPLPPPPPPPPRRTPEMILQEGNAALARRDYALAQSSAKDVLASGKGAKMTDAQFLMAQALFGKRDFSGAAVAFDDTYTRSRTGVHAQDSLLGLANSLSAIGEKRAACETLDKLHAEFPVVRGDLRDAQALARRGAGCK